MALVECRRFPTYPQALVARSALEAAGLHAVVFDEHRATITWTEQFSLNGIRVMVPPAELEAANELLGELEPPPAAPGVAWGPPGLMLWPWLAASVFIGWPIAGFRQPTRFHQVTAAVVAALFALAFALELWPR